MSETKTVSVGQIGRSLPRVEARAKVTGRAEYVHNLRLPGMLWAKIARSTVPHGRIRHIDTGEHHRMGRLQIDNPPAAALRNSRILVRREDRQGVESASLLQ
jgi:hypothetical protein